MISRIATHLVVLTSLCSIGCGDPLPMTSQRNVPARKSAPAAAPRPAASAPIAARGSGSDWPCFLGPTGDSKSTERGLPKTFPTDGPPVLWTAEITGGYSMPSVSEGRLFLFDRAGEKERLRALEPTTGRLLWTFTYPTNYEDLYGYDNGPRASPTVDGDRVYLFGAEGMLHCLRVGDGSVVWKVDTAAEFGVVQNFFGAASAPIIEGDLLIAHIGGSPPESRQVPPGALNMVVGSDSAVVAFDKATGRVRYKFFDELASYASPTLATIGERRWCFVLARGGLLGFEPASGKLDFHFPWRASLLESVNASNPVVVGDLVFISETYGPGSALLRVKPGACEVVWSDQRRREKAVQTHWNTAIHLDGYLYASSGRHEANAELRCVKLTTGEVVWSEPNLTRSSLLYVDGHFVCQSEDGTLRLLRVNNKKYDPVAEWNLREKPETDIRRERPLLRAPAWSAPILAHGLLYVRGMDRLACLDFLSTKETKGKSDGG